ncbi:3-hydroxyacyl-ACP dehydratase FabZ [Sinorhizobium sp. A49]|jgi:3-hydroxyacyl-[acyl-carrier-protein] dehydratase|uniref:3-hydroxyacyl-ACP dehydratase FabZ n=1 Tax=Sinorhizobium sp. A49 TaxID=1945861 RepID=UPI000984CF91|nr:3-hydroxyacyl-ACP dehydratase FabZ [Sinorhizobium sp. A49]OOG69000.1 3-hydroxyacyl-[acyl-carrier-protein] dehydratase FabZ [Sinorhizobium sp. A49]
MPVETSELTSAAIGKILQCIPHRYPFLLVDRLVSIRGEEGCIGIKNVSMNEPQFQGHFPGNPVFPGVLIIEGMAQTAGVMCAAAKLAEGLTPKIIYMLTVDKARFRKPVRPGDVIEYHLTKLAYRRNVWRYSAEARVDGACIAQAEISAYLETEKQRSDAAA